MRIFYDPNTLHGRRRVSRAPVIYSVWLLLWFWFVAAFGLVWLALCIAVLAGAGGAGL